MWVTGVRAGPRGGAGGLLGSPVMELRQLRYFVAVVEEANFTRAAERLHVAQPGVSAQIRQLERELGQELLDRTGRAVRPTEAGRAVLPYARAALAAVEGARLAVDELTGLLRGRVAVGVVTSLPNSLLPDLLAGFHVEHPAVEIHLSEANSDRMVRDLIDGRLDLAFLGLAGDPPPGLAVQVAIDEEMALVVAPDDPLVGADPAPITVLRDRAVMSLPHGTGIRAVLENACAAAGFAPRVTFEVADPGMLAELAARGLGVTLVPRSLVDHYAGRLRAVEIDGADLRGRVVLAWRAEGPVSPAARALIERARALFPPGPAS